MTAPAGRPRMISGRARFGVAGPALSGHAARPEAAA